MALSTERQIFRERLLHRMAELKITSAELARQVKVSKDAISSYTTMRSLPTEETLERLAQVLKCKPSDLMPEDVELSSMIELREYNKPGFKLLVVRMPLPAAAAINYYTQLLGYESAHKGVVSAAEIARHAKPPPRRGRPKLNGAKSAS